MKVYEPEENLELPSLDILTFIFDSDWCSRAKEDTLLHVEAANPANSATKSQCRLISQRTAHLLRHEFGIGAKGLGKDVIVVTSSGNPYLPVLFYSTINAGGIFSGASTAFTVNELVRQIQDSAATLLLCTAEFEANNIAAGAKCGIGRDRILIIDYATPHKWNLVRSSDRKGLLDVQHGPLMAWKRITTAEEQKNTTACILYSSGTTGLPKGVRISHLNLVAINPICMSVSRRFLAQNPSFHFKTLAHLPMAHIAGIAWYTLNSVYLGGTSYWMQKFEFAEFVRYQQEFGCTVQFSVPPIWLMCAKGEVGGALGGLRVAATGAAPMGGELAREVSRKLGSGKTMLSQFYGTSETTGSITGSDWLDIDFTGSVGSAFPNTRLRLLSKTDEDVPEGEPGEVLVSGPIVCQGYHNRPEADKDSFLDGFYRTGDIAIYKNKKLYIVDRKKELIKYKGTQVAPAELEALLTTHPSIIDAAVIGVSDPESQGNEVPRAYVVRKEGSGVTEEEVKAFVARELSSYKRLRGGVVFVGEVPKSASGKILRRELRERAKREDAGQGKAKL